MNDLVHAELDWLDANWPDHLPQAVIHADLFPDNVLMLDDQVTGIIDFYFSCTDIRAFDVAVTHAAWCFSEDGKAFDAGVADALLGGYADSFGLTERRAGRIAAAGPGCGTAVFIVTRL